MYKSVIAGYSRSPFTMAKKGELIDIKPVNLLSEVIKNLVSKSKVNSKDIEDIVIGCAFQVGEQCFNIGKLVSFLSEMDIKTSGMTIDRWCGSSMEAIHIAAGKIAMGSGKAFICGGVESMTRVTTGFNPIPQLAGKRILSNLSPKLSFILNLSTLSIKASRTLFS